MTRPFAELTLVIATHNPGKLREIAELIGPYVGRLVSAGELGLPEPEETGDSFRANAELKALAAARAADLPVLADDSGLTVAALGGQPGIYSARWAGPGKDFSVAIERVRCSLPPGADTRAAFICALTLAWPDGRCTTVEGRVDGHLVFPPRGDRGFGYDPIFVPDGHDETFGEMDSAAKHAISHRADAFRQLVATCLT